jgi:hypothetical protein
MENQIQNRNRIHLCQKGSRAAAPKELSARTNNHCWSTCTESQGYSSSRTTALGMMPILISVSWIQIATDWKKRKILHWSKSFSDKFFWSNAASECVHSLLLQTKTKVARLQLTRLLAEINLKKDIQVQLSTLFAKYIPAQQVNIDTSEVLMNFVFCTPDNKT